MENEKEYVRIPRELTDHIAEAIAFEARCCGGIAYDIYEAIIKAAQEEEEMKNVRLYDG